MQKEVIWAKGKPCLCQRGHIGLSLVPTNLFLPPQLPHHLSKIMARPAHWASRNKSHNETAFHFWYSKILLLEFCLVRYPHQQDSSPLGKVLLCFTSCCELRCLANWICCCCCLVTNLCLTLCNPMDYIACQAPLSMGFSRQEYSSGYPRIKSMSPAMAGGFFTTTLIGLGGIWN